MRQAPVVDLRTRRCPRDVHRPPSLGVTSRLWQWESVVAPVAAPALYRRALDALRAPFGRVSRCVVPRGPCDFSGLKLSLHVSGTEPKFEPPIAENVDCGRFPGKKCAVPEPDIEHVCTQAKSRRHPGDRRQDGERRRASEVVWRGDHAISKLLCADDKPVEVRPGRHSVHDDAKFHLLHRLMMSRPCRSGAHFQRSAEPCMRAPRNAGGHGPCP
jgi:hypothetical protein